MLNSREATTNGRSRKSTHRNREQSRRAPTTGQLMPQTTEAPKRSVPRIAMPEGRLATSDPEVARIIDLEVDRQRHGLELIASENFVSPAVLEAMGTPLTNKYAEGLPGKRYYGGCEFVDMVEQLAIDRVKKLFSADHANVQAHSAAQANAAT